MYNILICDDEKDIVNALKIYLNDSNYHFLEAFDGEEAVHLVDTNEVHLVLMDIMMPKLDGIRATLKIREYSSIPIIILSAKSEDTDKILGLNFGADDYITKPFDPAVLKSKIASIINNRSLYRKKYIDKSAFNDESLLVNELDKQFMEQVVEYIEEKMMNEDFSIDTLAIEMAMSRSVFFKKIKSLTGQNPQEFIRDIKMKRAATLLREHKYSIGEIAYLTGYPNAKYFSTAFKKYYGCTPSSFVEDEISAPSYSDEV